MFTLYIVLAVVLLIAGFFSIPYSPLKSAFTADAEKLTQTYVTAQNTVITEDDIKDLPTPVQKYFRYCRFIGAPKMSAMKAEFRNVAFKQGKTGPNLMIDYTQYNFVARPQRLAFIKSSLFAVPFDGYDSFIEGKGGMKGVIAKLVTLFNEKGTDMDKASLATFLSECLLVPTAALQDYVIWEAVDETHAGATIQYYGIAVHGVFTFSDKGEMLDFKTNDRAHYGTDGSIEYIPWSAVCSDYKEQNGFMVPTSLKAVWNYNDGDLVYFDSNNISVQYY